MPEILFELSFFLSFSCQGYVEDAKSVCCGGVGGHVLFVKGIVIETDFEIPYLLRSNVMWV